jgi:hypothetical protein
MVGHYKKDTHALKSSKFSQDFEQLRKKLPYIGEVGNKIDEH